MNNKYIILLPIMALTFSCAKESEDIIKPEQPQTKKVETIVATINNEEEESILAQAPEVKTTYEIDEGEHKAFFYWNGDESFARVIRHFDTTKDSNYYDYYYADVFSSSGEKTDTRSFTCASPLDGDYQDMKIAFYPFFSPDSNGANVSYPIGDNTTFTYTLAESLVYDKDNPLDGVIPMVGYLSGEDYDFKPLTGILAIRMTGIPSTATKLKISSASYKMSGSTGTITGQTAKSQESTILSGLKTYSYDKGICQSLMASGANKSKTYTFENLDPSTEYTFYYPLPLSANHNSGTTTLDDLTIQLYAGSKSIYSTMASKSLTIKRGCITRLPLITYSASKVTAKILGNANNPVLRIWTGGQVVRSRAYISTSSEFVKNNCDLAFTTNPVDFSLKGWAGSNKLSTSGKYYLHYMALSADVAASALSGLDDERVVHYDTIEFYFLNDDDKDAIVAQYVRDMSSGSYNNTSGLGDVDIHGDNTITLEVSDNVYKGNVMITEFAGFNYDVSKNTFSTYPYDFSSFTSGSPIYGCYSQSYTYTKTTTTYGAKFFDVRNQTLYKDATSHNHNIGTEQTGNNEIDITFNSDGHTVGTYHDLVVWDNWIGNNYDNSYASNDFYFTYFVANKTKGMIDLAGKLSVSSSSTASGDTGGTAALIDKSASTFWHSVWEGVHSLSTTYGAYVDINLGSSNKQSSFILKFHTRSDRSDGAPTQYLIYGSNDNSSWTKLNSGDYVEIAANANKWFETTIDQETAYQYIRLSIIASGGDSNGDLRVENASNGTKYCSLAEIQLWER